MYATITPGCFTEPSPILDVIAQAAVAFSIEPEDLTGDSRTRALARQRQVAMAAARLLGHSYPMIGKAFGGRDHTTVIHAVKRVDASADLLRQATILAGAARAVSSRLL